MARGFIAEFLVKVTSKDAPKVKREVESVGAAVDRVAEAHSRADKSSRNFNQTMEKGVIGTANSTKSFSKMAETMGGGGTSLVGIYATLAANVFAVTAAFNALRSAAQVQQVLNGLEAAGNRVGLTLSVTTRRVQELAGGMLTAEQAARSTAQFMAGGFKTEQLERFTALSRDISIALGRNMTDSMDRLTRGVLKLEPELLDELGIMTKLTDATAIYAAKMGKPVAALTQFERRVAFSNAVLAEGELKFGGLAEAAGNTTVYDKLSATFSNLTKDVFGFINGAIAPLIGAIADSKIALVGMITLFASSIKGQLLPMFNDLGKRGELAGRMLAESSLAGVGALSDTLKARDSDIQDWVGNVENGTAKFSDFRKVYAQLGDDITSLDQKIARNTEALASARGRAATKLTNTIREDTMYLEHLREVNVQMQRYGTGSLKGTANTLSSNAINLASTGNLREGVSELKQSFATMNEAAVLSEGSITRLDKAMFKTANTARFLGAAFLYALPYIGLLIAAGGFLYSWLTKVSPAQEKVNKAYEDFGEIAATSAKKAAEFQKITLSEASASSRALSAAILRGQAINELVNGYTKLGEAIAESQKEADKIKLEEQAELLRKSAEAATYAQDPEGAKKAKKAERDIRSKIALADKLGLSVNDVVFDIFSGTKDMDVATIKLTSSLAQLDKNGLQKVLQSYGALDENQKAVNMSGNRWKVTIAAVAKELQANNNAAQYAIQGTADAFKVLDDAIGKFTISRQQSTPYDDIVKGYDAAVEAVERLTIEFQKGIVSAEQYYSVLSGIGQRTATVIDTGVQSDMNEFNRVDAAQQLAKAKLENLTNEKEIAATTREIAQLDEKRSSLGIKLAIGIKEQLLLEQEIAREAQAQTRNLDSQIKKLQAQRSTYESIYQLNGAGLLAQYEQEERIRALQVEKLKTEAHHHKRLIATAEAQITILETSKEQTFELAKQEIVNRRLLEIENLKSAVVLARLKIEKGENQDDELARIQARVAIIGDLKTLEEEARRKAELANKEIDLSIRSQRNNIAANRDALKGLNDDIAAILMQNLSMSQKQANARMKDYEISQKSIEMLSQQSTLLNELQETSFALQNINDGINNSLANQVILLRRGAAIKRAEFERDNANTIEGIRRQRDQIQANKDRAAQMGDSTEAARIALANAEQQVLAEEQLLETRSLLTQRTAILQEIELATFDVRKEGVEWQKQALDLQLKAVDTAKSLATEELKNTQAAERNARLRSGSPVTEEMTTRQEIEAKIQGYKFAIQELQIRETMIDLEYALLDAQRQALAEELRTRREILLSENTQLTEDSPRIRQLTTAINNLDKAANTGEMAEAAKGILRAQAEGLRLELEGLSVTTNKYVSDFMEPFVKIADLAKLQQTRKQAAFEALGRPGASVSGAVITNDNAIPLKPELLQIEKRLAEPLPVMIQLKTNLDVIAANTTELVNLAGSSVATGPLGDIRAAQAYAEKVGLTIGERVGVDSGGHTGAGHREGRAFDASIAGGNQDTTNPQFLAKMNRIVQEYVRQGFTVLFNGMEYKNGVARRMRPDENQHLDHMHVEVARGFKAAGVDVAVKATADNTQAIAQTIAKVVEIPKYVGGDIAVSGTGSESLVSSPVGFEEFANGADIVLPQIITFKDRLDQAAAASSIFMDSLRELGPQGDIVANLTEGMLTIGYHIDHAFQEFKDGSLTDKIIATAGVISSVLSTINSVSAAASQAKIANIDAEIAAEQKRDGKSAESILKLQALERKKDQIAKKQFNMQKKMMIAQAVMSTAAAVAGQLASPPVGPWNIALAAMMGALGAAQIAIIASTNYQSTNNGTNAADAGVMPTSLSVGKRGDTVDLAKSNPNPGGELGYLRGDRGYGTNSSNYAVIGSAYGGPTPRGYGNAAYAVGEHGPEVWTPETPMTVRPLDKTGNNTGALPPVNFNIQALDAKGVEEILIDQRGNIIGMLREAANANGQSFLEDVNTSVYTKPQVSRL